MPFAISVNTYIGGEVRWTSSPFTLEASTNERTTEVVQSAPEKTRTPLLDYSAQLETAGRARLSGYGELPLRKTNFSKQGSRALQRSGRAMDDYAQKPQEILFFTGTLPGSGSAQFEAIARWSSWIVHRLKAWVGKRVEAKFDMYCWELQKRGALHIHYALHVPDEDIRFEIRSEIKNEWIRLLQQVSEFSGVDLFRNENRGFSHRQNLDLVQADCQEVEKSVGSYLGKYLSKAKTGKNSTSVFNPCRWWGVSRPLREYEESLRRSLRLTFGKSGEWLNAIDDLRRIFEVISEVGFEWVNKVMPGYGGVQYAIEVETLEEMLQLNFGERMKYASVNAKLRDKWRDLVRHLDKIDNTNEKWLKTMMRKHRSVSRWYDLRRLSGQALTSPEGIERIQHFTWGFQDLLHDRWNTWKPRLERGDKSRLIYLLREVENALLLHYEIDLKEFSDDEC